MTVTVRGEPGGSHVARVQDVHRLSLQNEPGAEPCLLVDANTADCPYYPPADARTYTIELHDGDDRISIGGAAHVTDERPPYRYAFYVETGGGADSVTTAFVATHVRAGAGADRISGADSSGGGSGDDRILGTRVRDILEGGPGADAIRGGSGPDVIWGNLGADRLYGGPGNDRLHGGPGVDRVHGGLGRDWVFGGTGRDWVFQR